MLQLSALDNIPTLKEIQQTHEAIESLIHRTPVLTCASIDAVAGARLFFKCENFQKVGAFKMRGGASAAIRLTPAEKERGIATHSSGNHAQAVARAARELGIPAYIVMPENAPSIKKAATKGYGAEVIACAPTLEARETTLKEVVDRTGATFIHPYNDYNVIAGQATASLELLTDMPGVPDIMMAPVGGGGLMSGTALTTRYLHPSVKLIGAEPKAVDDACRSLKAGTLQVNTSIDTIADGLRTNLGEKTFAILHQHLDDILTVTEEQIVEAMRLTWERMKIIIEPSCAVPLAAVLANPSFFAGRQVGIILTGGNVDLGKLPF
jgi:threonine dehydratase